MYRFLLILLTVIFSEQCFAMDPCSPDRIVSTLRNKSMVEYRTTKDIPESIRAKLGMPFETVNPGQDWSTDCTGPGPKSALRFAGELEGLWVVYWESGGEAYTRHLTFICEDKLIEYTRPPNVGSIGELAEAANPLCLGSLQKDAYSRCYAASLEYDKRHNKIILPSANGASKF